MTMTIIQLIRVYDKNLPIKDPSFIENKVIFIYEIELFIIIVKSS